MHRVVVLDTNVYRWFNKDSFDAFLKLERQRQITPYADMWVMMELLAHLANPNDESFTSCRHALRRVYERCIEPSPGKRGGVLKDSEDQIALMVTGKRLPGHDEGTQRLCELCYLVAMTPPEQNLPFGPEHVRWIADHVEKVEVWFSNNARELRNRAATILGQVDTDDERRAARATSMRELDTSPAYRTAIIESLVRGSFKDVGDKVPDPLPQSKLAAVRKQLAVGVEFYAQLMRKAIYESINLDAGRNRNLVWDQRISYCIGQKVDGSPLWFVTRETDFARAAERAGHGPRVRLLDNYLTWLNEKRHGMRRLRRAG